MSTDTQVQTLRLVLGDQLNPMHTWFQAVDPAVVYVLMEVRSETDYVVHHAQKVIAIFAAMRDFQRMLEAAGHRVHYLRINAPENQQHITKNLEYLAEHYG
ncbi:MAG: cryptochrome/photolyase family protein, partial [Burkholderiaceae bacterium]